MPDAASPYDLPSLVERYHAQLYRYAFRLSGNGADAEDLVQQAFLSIQASPGCLADVTNVRGWLFTVLRNGYLKSIRKPRPLNHSDVELAVEQISDEGAGELSLDGEALQGALAELPPEYRVPLLLFYFEDLSYLEIAEQLEIPPGTVMSRLSRAKRHLRARLTEHPVGETS